MGNNTVLMCSGFEFVTNSVQLRERKNGSLAPKRHQMKHLDFLILLLESRQSMSPKSTEGVGSIPTGKVNTHMKSAILIGNMELDVSAGLL